jgi:hypothetical protein
MQHMIEPLTEERHLLLIGVGVVGAILRKVVELHAVLVHTPGTLLQVQELLKLASHQARKDVVSKPHGTQPMALGGRPR